MPVRPPVHRPKGWKPGQARQDQLAALDDRRGSSAARGYSSDWQRVRLLALEAEPLCRFCAKAGKVVAATEVDHEVPIALAPERRLDPTNLRPLCRSCHARLTASGVQRKAGRNSAEG